MTTVTSVYKAPFTEPKIRPECATLKAPSLKVLSLVQGMAKRPASEDSRVPSIQDGAGGADQPGIE